MKKRQNSPLYKVGDVVSVDLETGEETPIEGGGMMLLLLPPALGMCAWCAVAHEPDQPHNQQSLYYQIKFQAIHGRAPTWSDAMAHCSDELKAAWKEKLIALMKSHGMEIPPDLTQE